MKKSILYLAFSGMVVLFMAMTCENTDDPATLEAGAPAPEYTPLSIQAEVKPVDQDYAYKGRLDESLVRYFLMSACADLLNEAEDPVTYQTCLTLKESTVPADNCDVWFCTMQIALCAGNFAMEIAEAVDVKEIPEMPLDLVMTQDGSFVPASEKGIFEVVNERLNGVDNLVRYRIRIPPQSAEDKTIAVRLGMLGFYMAGIHGAEQLLYKEEIQDGVGDYRYKCLDAIFSPADGLPGIEMVNSEGKTVTKADVFSVTYGEAVRNYSEATQALVQNTIAVGDSQFSREMDFSKAATLDWVGVNDPFAPPGLPLENSKMGALVTLAGGLKGGAQINDRLFDLVDHTALNSPHVVIRECTQSVDRDSVQTAIALLRAAGVASVLRESASDDDVVSDMMIVFASKFAMPQLLPGGTGHSMELGDFLELAQMTMADIHAAREYLKGEIRAYHRPLLSDNPVDYQKGDGTTAQVERIFGLSNINTPLPGEFIKGKLASLPTIDQSEGYECTVSDSYNIDCPYAATSASAALDFMRRAASITLHDNLIPDDYEHLFKEAELFAQDVAGDKVVEMEAVADSEGDIESMEVIVHGVEQGETISLYFSDEGFYCAYYGNMAGMPCSSEDYLIEAETTTAEDDLFPGKTKIAFAIDGSALDTSRLGDLRINGGNPEFGSSVDIGAISVISTAGSGAPPSVGSQPSLVTRLTVEPGMAAGGVQHSIVTSGGLIGNKAAILNDRNSDNCANPKTFCAGLPYDLVPPLENELTQDSDPYENSWRHYLDLARMKADRTDSLGEQLIEEGLEMDLRAEGALESLEALCGDIDADNARALDWLTGSGEITDPGLRACLGDSFCPGDAEDNEIPCGRSDVTLGSDPICVIRNSVGINGVAQEDIDKTKCTQEGSPFRRLRDDVWICVFSSPFLPVQVTSDYSGSACTYTVETYLMSSTAMEKYVISDIGEDKALKLFSLSKDTKSPSECQFCDGLQINPSDPLALPDFSAIARVIDCGFLTPDRLSAILRTLEFDEDIAFYFSLSMIGSSEAILGISQGEGPYHTEIKLEPSDNTFMFNSSRLIRGFYLNPDTGDFQALMPPLFDSNHSFHSYRERQELVKRIARIIMQISHLAVQNPSVILGKREGACNLPDLFHMPGEPGYILTCQSAGSSNKVGQCVRPPEPEELYPCRIDDTIITRVDRDSCETYGCGEVKYPESAASYTDIFEHMIRSIYLDSAFQGYFEEFQNSWTNNNYTEIIFDRDSPDQQNALVDQLSCSAGPNCETVTYVICPWPCPFGVCCYPEDRCECEGHNNFCFTPLSCGDQSSMMVQKQEMLDVLYFLCGYNNLMEEYTLSCLDEELPMVETLEDLNKVSKYLRCGADEIMQKAGRIVIPRMPDVVLKSFKEGDFETGYPALSGAYLTQLNRIQTNLNVFSRLTHEISEILYQMANTVQLAKHELKLAETRGEIAELEREKAIIQEAAAAAGGFMSAVASFFSGDFGGALSSTSDAAVSAAALAIDEQIADLEEEATQEEKKIILHEHMGTLHSLMTNLRNTFTGVQDAYLETISAVNDLDTMQNQAKNDYTKALMLAADETGLVYPVNTVMRRRYNTLQKRYLAALDDARKMAFIARKAIEFRLGIDLRQIQYATLVEPPSRWADDVCRLEGMDYEKISRTVENREDIGDYADSYIGDYVTKLENFVESYSFDYPFSDGDDLAVISIKDDILQARSTCPAEESPNRIYFSEDFGLGVVVRNEEGIIVSTNGWSMKGCGDRSQEDPPCDPAEERCYDNCIQVMQDRVDCLPESSNAACPGEGMDAVLDLFSSRADLIRDVPCEEGFDDPDCPRIEGFPNSGYVTQTVRGLAPGWYILSWNDMFPDLSSSGSVTYTNDYKVVLLNEGIEVYSDTLGGCPNCTEIDNGHEIIFNNSTVGVVPHEWSRRVYILQLPSFGALEIQVHPSSRDDASGMVWLAAMQLEAFDPQDPDLPDPPIPPGDYYSNEDQRIVVRDGCRDVSGENMRSRFKYDCPISAGGMFGSEHCYYEYTFSIDISDIEEGLYLTSNAIALDNYNYRHNQVAVNLVGTNVRDCTAPDAATSCYSNGYIPYRLVHGGYVGVRNQNGEIVNFMIPDARIEYGKGLAAEVTVTNPLSGSMETMLAPYQNSEFRGRPIQGTYTIRIYKVPELDWSKVEDIQLVWNYHFWTRFRN